MKIVCDACGAKYSIADEKVAGKVFKIRCKKCSNIIVVRGNASEPAAAAVPQAEPQVQPNKDTKVFDYEGYDSPQAAAAATDEGDWHLVIDQEQVGPMTAAQVRKHFAAGDIDTESFIWKEGFADWEKVIDVGEFANLGQAQEASPAAAAGNMFGSASDADVKTDRSAALAPEAAGADLFGDSGGAAADLFSGGGGGGGGGGLDSADLFGGMGDGAGSEPSDASSGGMLMSKEAESQLKGQRNENSVLFSLGNLAALASDSPKPMASSSHSAGAGSANTGGSEGSGLIDIRQLAQGYGAKSGGSGAGGSMSVGSGDDLPVFASPSLDSISPVLLPIQSSGADYKVLYALVGVIGALVIAAAVLIVIVTRGGDEVALVAIADEGADPSAKVAENLDNEDVGSEGDLAVEVAGQGSDEGAAPAAPADESASNGGTTNEGDEPPQKAKKTAGSKRRDTKKASGRKKAVAKTPTARKVRKASSARSTSSGSSSTCDEVACMLEPGKACCRKYNSKSRKPSSASRNSSSNSNLPASPSRGDVKKGMSKIQGRVTSCGDKHGGNAKVIVKIKIAPSGKVSSAQATGGGSALRNCVASAVKRARFPKTQNGLSVSYPFKFR